MYSESATQPDQFSETALTISLFETSPGPESIGLYGFSPGDDRCMQVGDSAQGGVVGIHPFV